MTTRTAGSRGEVKTVPMDMTVLLEELLAPRPQVFMHTHYLDPDPAALLSRRDGLLRALAAADRAG